MDKKELSELIWRTALLVTLVALVLVEWQKGQKPVRCEVTINNRQYDELIARIDEIRNDVHDSADSLEELTQSASGQ